MEWYVYLLLAVVFLIVVYFISTFIAYKKAFTNPKSRKVQNIDNTPYKAYKEFIGKQKELYEAYKKEPISVNSKDNLTLRGVYIENKIKDKIVIIFHGYKSNGESDILMSYDFLKLGYSAIVVDQRGHGKSDGKYIGMGILERYDVLTWIDYAIDRFGENIEILLNGISMGAATVMMASELVKSKQVKGIVADCGFSSCYDEVRYCLRKLPSFPIMQIVNLYSRIFAKYDMKETTSAKSLANSEIPILLVHGKKDDFVPCDNLEKCYNASKSKIKDSICFENAIHASSYADNSKQYDVKVEKFLEKINF